MTLFFFCFIDAYAQHLLSLKHLTQHTLCSSTGTIKVYLLTTAQQHQQGFSNFHQSDQFSHRGLYFKYEYPGKRRFWMPETFFSLDIIFLNSQMKIIAIERDIPFYPHKVISRKKVPRTKTYMAKDVLEIPSGSKWSKQLRIGEQLTWCSQEHGL